MKLDILTYSDCIEVAKWRNQCPETLRTPGLTSESQQAAFYNAISDKNSKLKYWKIIKREEHNDNYTYKASYDPLLIGAGGLDIQWENRLAEISLIINPIYQKYGHGKKTVDLILEQGFNILNLQNIFGECYYCNQGGIIFWDKITKFYNGEQIILPARKYWGGKYYGSMYFNINKNDWRIEYEKNGI